MCLVLSVMLTVTFAGSCSQGNQLDAGISQIANPYHFSIAGWQIKALSLELEDWLLGEGVDPWEAVPVIREYFSLVEWKNHLERSIQLVKDGLMEGSVTGLQAELYLVLSRKSEVVPVAEKALAAQIEIILLETGIYNPSETLSGFNFVFPSVNFTIQPPPHLLVVSPRYGISRLRDITLAQDMTVAEREAIEDEIDALGLSGLVVQLGGIATYPAFVAESASIHRILEVAIEEWFHQYLFFKPLGFLYGLHVAGIKQDYEIATVNEAFAGIVSREIAGKVYDMFYRSPASAGRVFPAALTAQETFDFFAEMRRIRLQVDAYLEQGRVEEAELFMEESQLYLANHGYVIRKLNQAFFAFYGTYADSPISPSPIGAGLRELRQQNPDLKSYVEAISGMTDATEIRAAAPDV